MESEIKINGSQDDGRSLKKERTGFIADLLDWLKTIAVTIAVVVLIFTFVAKTAIVHGRSMENTLFERDFLVLWSLFYSPKQGDIVAANCMGLNRPDGEVIVKRVIAVGGQTVDIDFSTGTVYVDGEVLNEPYIKNATINDEGGFSYPVTVPEGSYFCMGDNRQHSTDSRDANVGFIEREDILGKAVLRIYPFNSITVF